MMPTAENPVADAIPRRLWAIVVALNALAWGLQLYALWSRDYVPLHDLPNHMARHYLESLKFSGDDSPSSYQVQYAILPNLGADLFAPALFAFSGPLTATKVLLTVCVFLFWLGPALFVWQHGGFRPAAFVASLLLLPWVFNSQFFWGFLNYYSGVGLAFLVLTQYCRLGREGPIPVVSLVVNGALVTLLFLWHLAPWMIYGTLAGSYWLSETMADYLRARKLGRTLLRALLYALPVVPSMVLLALYVANNRDLETATVYNWGGVPRKLSMPLSAFRGYSTTADVAAVLLWAAAAVSIFGITAIKGVRRDWLSLGLFALIALYLVLPYQAQRTSDADSRLLPAIFIGAVACLGTLPPRRLALGAVLLASSLVVRDGSIIRGWDRLSDRLTSHARAFPLIEHGGRVLPAVLLSDTSKAFPEAHFLCWAVIQRGAFVPSLFANKDQQPLKLTPSGPDPLERGPQGYAIDARTAQQYFDYAWVYNPKGERLLIPSGWRRLYSANSLTLWQIP